MLPFTLEPILLKMECGRYVGQIIMGVLADLLAGIRTFGARGSYGGKGNGAGNSGDKVGASGGGAKLWVH